MNLGRALIFEIDPVLASEVSPRDVHLGMVSIFEIDPVLRIGGLSSRRDVVAAAPTSRQGCAARHRDAATANLGGRRSSRSIPPSASEVSPRDVNLEGRRSSRSIPHSASEDSPRDASEVSPRDVNLGRASILEVNPALSVGGLTSDVKSLLLL